MRGEVLRPDRALHVRAAVRMLQPQGKLRSGDPRADRTQRRVAAHHGSELREPEVRVSPHDDIAVAPRLAGHPVERVIAVGDLVDRELGCSLGTELAPHVLHDDSEPVPGEVARDLGHEAVRAVLVVGQAHEDHRRRLPVRPRVDVSGQPGTVTHRYQDRHGVRRDSGRNKAVEVDHVSPRGRRGQGSQPGCADLDCGLLRPRRPFPSSRRFRGLVVL